MKILIITLSALLIGSILKAQISDSVKIADEKFRLITADSSDSSIREIYRSTVPSNIKVMLNSVQSRMVFFNDMINSNQAMRGAANAAKLSIHKRLLGIKSKLRQGRAKLKSDFIEEFDNTQNNSALGNTKKDEILRSLRTGLNKPALELRAVGNREYRYIYYRADIQTVRLLPARNSRFSQLYYSELRDSSYLTFLRNQFLTFNEDFGALSSEIVAAHLGPFRASLNTAISRAREIQIDTSKLVGKSSNEIAALVNTNHKENISKNTLANILAGGGLVGFKVQYPIFYFNPIWNPHFRFDNEFVGNLSAQFNTAGTITPENETSLWGSYGIQNNAYIPFIDFNEDDTEFSAFGAFFQYNIQHISGSGTFYDNLDLKDGTNRKGFWYGEFKIGLFFKGIQLTYSLINFSNKELDGQFPNTFKIAYAPK